MKANYISMLDDKILVLPYRIPVKYHVMKVVFMGTSEKMLDVK